MSGENARWLVLAGFALAGCVPARADVVVLDDVRFVSAEASCEGNGQSDADGPVVRGAPGTGLDWTSDNGALASAIVSGVSTGASSVQLSTFEAGRVAVQGSTSLSGAIGANVVGPSLTSVGRSVVELELGLSVGSQVTLLMSTSGVGEAFVEEVGGPRSFVGPGVFSFTVAFPRLRLVARAEAILQGPPGGAAGGGYAVQLIVDSEPPGCPADLDDGSGSGLPDQSVTIDDLVYFLDRFGAGDVRVDLDDGTGTGTRDQSVTIDDLIYFLLRFAQGC